jgi:hypothetical protein
MVKSPERVQLDLKIASAGQNPLDDLLKVAERTSFSELIRKALPAAALRPYYLHRVRALYDLYLEHQQQGGEVIFRHLDRE